MNYFRVDPGDNLLVILAGGRKKIPAFQSDPTPTLSFPPERTVRYGRTQGIELFLDGKFVRLVRRDFNRLSEN